jgi:hypothetical protein
LYEIIGTDRRYGMKQSYGRFRTLKDCLTHMESLKRSFGNIIKFRYKEVESRERHNLE